MAVGEGFTVDGGNIDGLGGKITLSVVITCFVAATCGLIFGDDIGISDIQVMSTNQGTGRISKGYAIVVLVLMRIYAAGFGWSWGPLAWLIPSEIFPMKIRSTGQSITVAVNLATTFVLSQAFLTMLCHFKYGTFPFYAAWIAVMTIFVVLFLPETKGVPLHSMHVVWERHWYWQSAVETEYSSIGEQERADLVVHLMQNCGVLSAYFTYMNHHPMPDLQSKNTASILRAISPEDVVERIFSLQETRAGFCDAEHVQLVVPPEWDKFSRMKWTNASDEQITFTVTMS